MPFTPLAPGLFELSLGPVRVFLLESEDGWALIDTGLPASADRILAAFRKLGHQPTDIRHIILTHAHPDHIGGLAALKQATQAATYMHPADAPIARTGTGFRPITPSPGLLISLMFRLFMRPAPLMPGTPIDHEVSDGDVLPIAGGLTAVHTPGHCAGHLAFLWPRRRVLFAADACSNMPTLGLSLGYEDIELGRKSLAKLARLDFDAACFGHGKTILYGAVEQFRKRWA